MKEIATFKLQFKDLSFKTIVFIKGQTYILEIIGPEDHLGGIGMGMPYVKRESKLTANCHAISYPGHRDGELAAEIAQIAAKITRKEVLVILGIHISNLTKTKLKDLKDFFREWMTEISQSLI